MHDATVDRTTNGTGHPSTFTEAGLRQLLITTAQLGPGWNTQLRPPLLIDVLDDLGGRSVIFVGAKDGSAQQATHLANEVIKRGLTDSVALVFSDVGR